ncbi:hypothetical protein D3C79_1050330 [compost metagenome]
MQPPYHHADDGAHLRDHRQKANGAVAAVGGTDALDDQRRPHGDHRQRVDQAEIHQAEHQHRG